MNHAKVPPDTEDYDEEEERWSIWQKIGSYLLLPILFAGTLFPHKEKKASP